MSLHPLAGQPAPADVLVNIPRLMAAYYNVAPNPEDPAQQVGFGTSGHRGTSTAGTFNEAHILATSQAICDYRNGAGYSGPLYLGLDTHALSEAAFASAVQVFAANGVALHIQEGGGYTPTPVISHAILTYNSDRKRGLADGVVITPSHNPPTDGGFKYNPPTGGPAGTEITRVIQDRANAYLNAGLKGVARVDFRRGLSAASTTAHDFITPYVADLGNVIDMGAIARAGLRIGVDPMGGAGIAYWEPIRDRYGLDLHLVNDRVDPTFAFMTLDKDGQIRMDCSSPYAMASLIRLKDDYDIAFGNDPDFDRHGIVTPSGGLMNPNHFLAVAIWYLFQNRPAWPASAMVGKTLVSSAIIDRVAAGIGRNLAEVPVGFKWFVKGLMSGDYGFGGEESAGASFLRRNGTVWTTDKDGIIMDLLAAEITATTGQDPSQHYLALTQQYGGPVYARTDAPATAAEKAILQRLSPEQVKAEKLAGDPILARLTAAPGNGAPIGGLKVVTRNGWFAARPSGTEAIYKIYAESFVDATHLRQIQAEARQIVSQALATGGA